MTHQLAMVKKSIDLTQPGGWSDPNAPSIVTAAVSFFTFDLAQPDAPPSFTTTQLDGALLCVGLGKKVFGRA